MEWDDFSPPPNPNNDQQMDALRKGLGRAMNWALTGRLENEILLNACLENHVFDTMCEPSRSSWLWELLEATSSTGHFRNPILRALENPTDARAVIQLSELAKFYAKGGDDEFRTSLYRIVEQKPFSSDSHLGEKELLDVEGEKGFLFLTRLRGIEYATRDWEWKDRYFVEDAVDRFGEKRVETLLEESSDENIIRFRAIWKQTPEQKALVPSQSAPQNPIRMNKLV
ncbi:hypothetical protein KIH39_11975 [Telmatocola sphagniphila]|uniref:Uncharacterized protein n=1 Tax=Telmatocola sphagniphila TaxID=1123043 RepID=A0A8E6BAS6_9BACT|nr:hypothetical protein [Telmatocola sphagniphila]QVL34589.1 hypothetical protein KIH39_11975 [Telmatocola sphagniphila]